MKRRSRPPAGLLNALTARRRERTERALHADREKRKAVRRRHRHRLQENRRRRERERRRKRERAEEAHR